MKVRSDNMASSNRKEAVEKLQTGFLDVMSREAANYVAPVFWGPPPSTAGDMEISLNNGSIFFLERESSLFAVTADHVYAAYLERKQDDPQLVCQIYNILFVPEERLIDRDPRLDLVTFRITEDEVYQIGKWIYRAAEWPPSPPEIEKGVFTVGFPRQRRKVLDKNSVEWGIQRLLLTATKVNDSTIVCQFEREEWVDLRGLELPEPPPQQSLGGLSGAPLWTLAENAIISWRLAGVVYEFHEDFELLYVRRPSCIKADGTLLRGI